jgi:hypothetical protein
MDGDEWVHLEAAKALTIAKRLFPNAAFFISDDVPASQTYERGSINQQIRDALESRTRLRFDRGRFTR